MKNNWLKQQRQKLNISQEDLAERLQLSGVNILRSTVSHWETGRTPLPMKEPAFADALAEALEITRNELLILSGYIEADVFSENAMRAAGLVERMPPERQNTALTLLESLLKEQP